MHGLTLVIHLQCDTIQSALAHPRFTHRVGVPDTTTSWHQPGVACARTPGGTRGVRAHRQQNSPGLSDRWLGATKQRWLVACVLMTNHHFFPLGFLK